jgi:hypothetical protein
VPWFRQSRGVGCRHVAVLAGCAGCLISEPPDGSWHALTDPCVALDADGTQLLRNESHLQAFTLAGDTIVFDDDEGLSQLTLPDRHRSLIARTNSEDASSEFQTIENDLVYYARGDFGDRDLVVDHGIAEDPRWLTIASFSLDDFTIVHANRAGVYWRTDAEGRWRRWKRETNKIVASGLPPDATVTTDGNQLFYKSADELYTLPIDGGDSTLVATVDEFTEAVGIGDSRLFVWHQDTTELDEVTTAGLHRVTTIVDLPAPGRRAFGGAYFYWVAIRDGPDSILRVPINGGSTQIVATLDVGAGDFGTVQADACSVYWQVVHDGTVDLWGQGH